jgi:tight adherence protein B
MKAGHNMHAGLETIAQETFDPVRMEFKKVIEELALGAPLEDTLHGLGRRIPLIDLKFFITGLILQRQTGADMVQVLRTWRCWCANA